MTYSLVQRVYTAALGKWISQPLKHWLEEMYRRIDHIEHFEDLYFWLQDLRKLPEIQRRSGTGYEVENYWAQALEMSPMLFFAAADTAVKDWRQIFLSIDRNPQSYMEFWDWAADPYQVRIWLAQVFREFWNMIWQEHRERLDGTFKPSQPANLPDVPEMKEEKAPKAPKTPKTWEEEEEAAESGDIGGLG